MLSLQPLKFRTFAVVVCSFVFLAAHPLWAQSLEGEIPNFRQVSDGLFRGGRPNPQGLLDLHEAGIKTIINLESNLHAVTEEEEIVAPLAMQFLSIPLKSFRTPKDADVKRILEVLNNPANYPIFIHCLHGQDRTGLIVGLFRIFSQGWPAKQAYAEMLQNGFHRILFPLDKYFRRVTEPRNAWIPNLMTEPFKPFLGRRS